MRVLDIGGRVEDLSRAELRRQYHRRARACHPDKSAAADASAKGAKPTEKIVAGPASGKSATAAVKPAAVAKGDGKDAGAKDPNAKKEDLQLTAALNHLKGLPLAAATTTATVTTK